MTKPEVVNLLKVNHQMFIESFANLDEHQFTASVNGKWSPGQQLDHIIKSVRPVVLRWPCFRLIMPGIIKKAVIKNLTS